MNTREQGMLAEKLALKHLENNKLKLVTQNYHCRGGEIDLIMRDESEIVFVEVRYRKNIFYGSPIESVTRQKQNRIIHTAQHYIQHHPQPNQNYRFDIVGISHKNEIKWVKGAFQLN